MPSSSKQRPPVLLTLSLTVLYRSDRIAVLDAIKAANLKYVRLFISYTAANNKDTGSREMPDIEPVAVGTYDDTQLNAIDQLMVEAHARGIKLTIALHDRYQLGCWGNGTCDDGTTCSRVDGIRHVRKQVPAAGG